MSLQSRLLTIGLVAASLLTAREATAQEAPTSGSVGPADAARAFFEQGFFDEALASVEGALTTGATRNDTARLLETRALVQLALGDHETMRQTLFQLLSLAPSYTVPGTASPDFTAEVDRIRPTVVGPLHATIELESSPSHHRVTATLVNDPGGLSARAAIRARDESDRWVLHESPWRANSAGSLRVQPVVAGPGNDILWEGEAVDVEAQGLPRSSEPAGDGDSGPPFVDDTPVEGSDPTPWIVASVAGGVLAAAAIVAVLTLSGDTQYAPAFSGR